ncbi:MAG: hypothetical protein IJB24_05455 [Clostridia bacterium]|nr:hypothetical protein [Clostridia bacterium]
MLILNLDAYDKLCELTEKLDIITHFHKMNQKETDTKLTLGESLSTLDRDSYFYLVECQQNIVTELKELINGNSFAKSDIRPN